MSKNYWNMAQKQWFFAKGFHNALGVHSDTIQILKSKGVEVHIDQTNAAIRLYNELREHEPVGGLIHTRC
jgi:hypothetical protein